MLDSRPNRRSAHAESRPSLPCRALAALALAAVLSPLPAAAQDKPVSAAYYYKVRWGFQQEFERLFFKNHYPVLKDQMGAAAASSP